MKLFCKLILLLFILLFSMPGFSQMNADSVNKRIDAIYSNYTSEVQTMEDLKLLAGQCTSDSLLLIVKKALTVRCTYSFPDSALVYGMASLDLAKKINSKREMAESYQALGEVLRILGNYPKAVAYTLKALPLEEEIKDTSLLFLTYDQLGISYNGDKDFQNAIQAIFKALSFVNNPKINYNDSAITDLSCIYLAEVYSDKNVLDSALYYGKKARHIDSLLRRNWSWISLQLGKIHTKIKNEQQALMYYNNALHAFWVKDSIDAFNGIAELYLSGNKPDSAIRYANGALTVNISHSYLPELLASSTLLSDAYEKKGNKDSTLKYLKLSISIKDSLFNLAKIREVQSLSLEEQSRQEEIEAREKREEENHIRNLQLLAIGIFIPIFFIGVLLLSRTRVRPRVVEFLGIFSLLLFFEFITDLIYPYVSLLTNENPIWEMLFLVVLAALLEPLNFKLEHWVKHRLVHKPVPVPIPVPELPVQRETDFGEII